MKASSPNSVGFHSGTCTAFALATAGAPFVPEAIAAYTGYRYLRGFVYRFQQWHAPARVPLHLGRQGYRDATTGKRGTATWPIGSTLSDKQQIWLASEDLRQGSVHLGPEPIWLRQRAETMTFGACLNQMGALIVDDGSEASLSGRLRQIAAPFGRDAGLVTVDLTDPFSDTLRISAESIVSALRASGVAPASLTVVEALAPVLAMIGRRYALDPLTLYPVYLREEALLKLAEGQYEIGGSTVDAKVATTADGQAFLAVNKPLAKIDRDLMRKACGELKPYADELATTRGLSLNRGFDLRAALHVGRMTYIRPSSAWTRHIVLKSCIEAMSEGELENVVIHVTCLDSPHLGQLELLRIMASKARAIASFAVLDRKHEMSESKFANQCALRFQAANVETGTPHFVVSKLQNCEFGLEYTPMAMWPESSAPLPAKPQVTEDEATALAEADAPPAKPEARPAEGA